MQFLFLKIYQLCDISNLLLQKWPAPDFHVAALIHLSHMTDGDICGMVYLGGIYTALAVKQESRVMVQRIGEWLKQNETETVLQKMEADYVYFRMQVKDARQVTYSYRVDGEEYNQIGETIEVTPGRWVGVKSGLFAMQENSKQGGYMQVEYYAFDLKQ